MNRSEKKTLKTDTRRFDSSIRLALHTYGEQLEGYMDREQDKLDRLPEQIRDSVTGEQIEESNRVLEELSDKLREIEDILDDILSLADTSSSFKAPVAIKETASKGRKGTSFHAVIPNSLMDRLKRETVRCGLSMNEIVCRALRMELNGEGNAGKNRRESSENDLT